jgi:polar amino acid transport system permease protein
LVFAAGVVDVDYAQQEISATTYQTEPMLLVACLWYLALTSVLMIGQYYIERHYARGSVRELPPTPLQRFKSLVGRRNVLPPATVDLEAQAVLGGLGRGPGGQHL